MNTFTKEEATKFFSILYRGEHHIPSELKPYGKGWKIAHYGDMATYDFDQLTRLVLLAHDKCIRASIMQSGPRRIGIAIWKRSARTGNMYEKHPTIETALAQWRTKHEATP